MEKIKVLHIDTEKGWRGGQQQAVYLFESMLRKGYETFFACNPGSKLESYFAKKNLPYFALKMKGELDLFSAFRIAKFSKENNINILHLHSAHAQTLGVLSKLFYNYPKTIAVRRVDFKIKNNILSKWKYNTKLLDKIVCVSHAVKDVISSAVKDDGKLTVIYSGIDIHKFDEITGDNIVRKKYNIPENDLLVGTVAALVGHKDYPTLLRAFSIVLKKKNNISFIAIGNGKDEKEIKRLHENLRLGNKFVFVGFQENVGVFLKSFDFFVFASKMEGLGTSVLDAQSVGLPVVGTIAGGIPEAVQDNINGLLVPPGSPEKLAEAILDLAENPQKRELFGKNAMESVKKFDINITVEKNIELYKEILQII